MNKEQGEDKSFWWSFPAAILTYPLWIISWPLMQAYKALNKHFFTYLFSSSVRDKDRIYSIKFIWYKDSVYLHPMIWGSFILFLVTRGGEAAGGSELVGGMALLIWFVLLFVCYMTVMYNFNVVSAGMLAVGIIAFLGAAYFSTIQWQFNPLNVIYEHIRYLHARVTPGFFIVSAYFFAALIFLEVMWAWLFHRVEIDESYVYEHRFLQGTTREPIFARGLKREIKDLLELVVLGAADIEHRTKKGVKRFKNVPFASLWLGTSIDSMLDYRRRGQVIMERKRSEDDADQVRIEDALHEDDELMDDEEGGDVDDTGADDVDDPDDDGDDDLH